MRQIIAAILIIISTQTSSYPLTSKALDNQSDHLIWQTAWLNDKSDNPFSGESKKITAKSIFITPNFSQHPSHCPPGFKIDVDGKCIKVVSINQGKPLTVVNASVTFA